MDGAQRVSSDDSVNQCQGSQPAAEYNHSSNNEHHSLSHAFSSYLAHDTAEKMHWDDVCRAYRQYATFAMAQWANHQYRLHALPEEQRQYLPPGLKRESPEFHHRAKLYKEAAIRNQFCLDCILRHAGQPNSQDILQHQQKPRNAATPHQIQHSTDAQMSKVSSVLKSLARDWSVEGKTERDMAYAPVLDLVCRYLPVSKKRWKKEQTKVKSEGNSQPLGSLQVVESSDQRNATFRDTEPPRVCVPGAGVARLACELAALGYTVQGNEFSLFMLLASDFILNGGMASPERPLQISPFLLESRNVHAATDPLRPIAIPDVDPYEMIMPSYKYDDFDCDVRGVEGRESITGSGMDGSNGSCSASLSSNGGEYDETKQADFSMAAGEFVSIYGSPREQERWDAFVACFFLDTAPCVIEYITVMHKSLKPGGFVFHFGPLLWHWSGPAMRPDDKTWDTYQSRYSYLDKKYLASMDLSWQDVRAIFVNVGFEVLEEKLGAHALYTSDRRSMMNMSYHCVQFVARKKGGKPLPTEPIPYQLAEIPITTLAHPFVSSAPSIPPAKASTARAGIPGKPQGTSAVVPSTKRGSDTSSITPSSSGSL